MTGVKKKRLGPEADTSLLTDADKERLRKKAADQVFTELKAEAEKQVLEDMIADERAKLIPQEEKEDVIIDLPAFASHLLIDGVYFYHGNKVTVTRGQAASIREQMARCWVHEIVSGHPN